MSRGPISDPLEPLRPESEADRRALFLALRDTLENGYASRGDAIKRLTLEVVHYLDGHGRRLFLRGDPTDATAVVRLLVEVTGAPALDISAPSIAETNWHGADLPSHIFQLRRDIGLKYGLSRAEEVAERAIVHVRHLDGVRLAGSYGSAPTRDHRLGQQQSLLPLIDGDVIPVARSGVEFSWPSSRALVVVSAALEGLGPRPDAADLAAWGIIEPLARRLASAALIELGPPEAADVAAEIEGRIRRTATRFAEFGYCLVVARQAIEYVVRAVTSGPHAGGAAAASAWIEAAAGTGLIRLLEDGAPRGSTWTVAIDDLRLPDTPKGVWRE